MSRDYTNDESKRPERPTMNGYRHKRNPSIRTLLNSKRYQQATPKHEMMERVFFSPHGDEVQDSRSDSKIQRLESVINRLRIENSHAMSKSATLQSKNSLLQKTLKHSKQQYTVLDAELKKCKNHIKYLQQRLNEMQSTQKDDDLMSIVSLKTRVANLEDTHKKSTVRRKKIKTSLENVINDPGLPSYLRNKLVVLLPNFYASHHRHSPSSLSAQMKFDILPDEHTQHSHSHGHSPPLSPISPMGIDTNVPIFEDKTNSPLLTSTNNNMMRAIMDILPQSGPILTATNSASTERKSKLMHYKKRNTSKHKKILSLSHEYVPKIQIITPERHQRSVSTVSSQSISYKSVSGSDDLYLFKDSESEHDTEEKEMELHRLRLRNTNSDRSNNSTHRKPSPRPRGQRRKPPPPPRKGARRTHPKGAQSDDLLIKKVKPKATAKHLNLSQIDEDTIDGHLGTGSDVQSPSNSSTKGNQGSNSSTDSKIKNLTLDTRTKRSRKIAKDKRVFYQRKKANTTFEFGSKTGHNYSKSHGFNLHVNDKHRFEVKPIANKLFHIGWKSKSKKKSEKKVRSTKLKESHSMKVPKQSRRKSKSEKQRAHKQYSMSAQIMRKGKKKKNKAMDTNILTMSKSSDAEGMSDSGNNSLSSIIMSVNPLSRAGTPSPSPTPLSPVGGVGGKHDILSSVIKYINHTELPNNKLCIAPTIKVSVSTPNSPLLKPLKVQQNGRKKRKIKDDADIDVAVLGTNNTIKNKKNRIQRNRTKSSSLQLTKNVNKDFYRNKTADTNRKHAKQKHRFSKEDITKKEPTKPMPMNTKNNPRITRMDQIKMSKLNVKPDTHKKRFSSPSVEISKNSKSAKAADRDTSDDYKTSPIRPKIKRRSSFSFKSRKKTDHFGMDKDKQDHKNKHKRGRRSKHSRSNSFSSRASKLERFSFSLSPRPRRASQQSQHHKNGSVTPKRRKMSFHFKSHSSDIFDGTESGDMDDFFEDSNKVWTVNDLISEMVSNGYDLETENRMRNALILCHQTFTTSLALLEELRRFFRMSITQMSQSILYFDDEKDDEYESSHDRRWRMRQKVTQCILYWTDTYWLQDFAHNKALQKEIEFFKSDIRSCIHDVNRSKSLLEPLMESLNAIKSKYGGINPKNLNLNPASAAAVFVPVSVPWDDDDNEAEEEEELSTSVVIHSSEEDVDDNTVVVDEGSFRRKKNTMNLMIQSRGRKVSVTDVGSDGPPAISKSVAAQNIIKSYADEKSKKELEKLTADLRGVELRYGDLIKLQLDVSVPHNFNIMELDPEDVAVQLTLLDSFVFMKISDRECIQQNWKKKDKAIRAPNILKMIAQFNDVSKWVQLRILSGKTARLRKRYIKKSISMASYFIQNGNLSSLCAFYNALTSSNILSLQASWKLLSRSKKRELQEIKTLFGWKMNKFKEMQQELQPPCVPHIGIILQILFQIDEGKQSKNPENQSINYIKMMMLYEEIYNLQTLQAKHYRDEPNFLIQKLLITQFKLQSNVTDNKLYKLAKSVAESENSKKTH